MLAITMSEAIRAAGQIPSGVLYAMMMGQISLEVYESILDRLVGAGLIRDTGGTRPMPTHLLTWIGPRIREEGK